MRSGGQGRGTGGCGIRAQPYSVWNLDAKHPEEKEALRGRFWLRKTWSPIVAYMGRLDE